MIDSYFDFAQAHLERTDTNQGRFTLFLKIGQGAAELSDLRHPLYKGRLHQFLEKPDQRRLACSHSAWQRTQRVAVGSASSRSSPIGRPQFSHSPYPP